MNGRTVAILAVLAWVFGAAQLALAPRMAIWNARPDFFLIALSACSPFLNRTQGAVIGFTFGLIHGAGVGANLSQYVATRTTTGFLAAWFNDVRLQPSFATMAMTGALATLFAAFAMMIFAPPAGIGKYLTDTMLSAVYNGVLVWPLYALLRRIMDPVYR